MLCIQRSNAKHNRFKPRKHWFTRQYNRRSPNLQRGWLAIIAFKKRQPTRKLLKLVQNDSHNFYMRYLFLQLFESDVQSEVGAAGEEGRPVSTLGSSGGTGSALWLTPRPWLWRYSRWQYYMVPRDAHPHLFLSVSVLAGSHVRAKPTNTFLNVSVLMPSGLLQSDTHHHNPRAQDTLPNSKWRQIKDQLNTPRRRLAREPASCDRNTTLGLPVACSAPIITAHNDATLTSAHSN